MDCCLVMDSVERNKSLILYEVGLGKSGVVEQRLHSSIFFSSKYYKKSFLKCV